MNETAPQPVVKLKRQLTEAQKAALKKGREALAAKRLAVAQTERNELVQVKERTLEQYHEDIFIGSVQETCIGIVIVLASYFIMFVAVQHA
jgi:hypothetical protein